MKKNIKIIEKDNYFELNWENIELIFEIHWDTHKNVVVVIYEKTSFNFLIKTKTNNKLDFKLLLVSSRDNDIKWKLNCLIKWVDILSNVEIISILWDKWVINLDWLITIEKNSKGVIWRLDKKTLILWDNIDCKMSPKLNIKSKDVQSWHSAKIETLKYENLFYLMSKWLSKNESKNLYLEWILQKLVSNSQLLEKLKKIVLTSIK